MNQKSDLESHVTTLRIWVSVLTLVAVVNMVMWGLWFTGDLPHEQYRAKDFSGGFVIGREFVLVGKDGQAIGRWNESGGFIPKLEPPPPSQPTGPPVIGPP